MLMRYLKIPCCHQLLFICEYLTRAFIVECLDIVTQCEWKIIKVYVQFLIFWFVSLQTHQSWRLFIFSFEMFSISVLTVFHLNCLLKYYGAQHCKVLRYKIMIFKFDFVLKKGRTRTQLDAEMADELFRNIVPHKHLVSCFIC